eukprot:TRINITY_DN4696_c0_g1_i1.p1 TRINITY_DN4696_c0_g1~~TRINITY_DN4696_c0_g1_i1.p1  ORF type:complete len:612 (-),score=98.74 TRINITY_DN4696_c0_g1_i1:372-2207(-)
MAVKDEMDAGQEDFLGAFLNLYPCDTRAEEFLRNIPLEVQQRVVQDFKPRQEGDADYSAALTVYIKRCVEDFERRQRNARPGDWECEACGDLQFARNEVCRKCGAEKSEAQKAAAADLPPPRGGAGAPGKLSLPGDWECPSCGDLQFASRNSCRKCGTPHPTSPGLRPASAGAPPRGVSMEGDWNCPSCGDYQFARNTECRRCGAARGSGSRGGGGKGGYTPPAARGGGPPAAKAPATGGDWYCPSCGDLQFARNAQCRRCGEMAPAGRGPNAAHYQPPSRQEPAYRPPAERSSPYGRGGHDDGKAAGKGPKKLFAGEWLCPCCGKVQFARAEVCRDCGVGPDHVGAAPAEQAGRPGDWTCPECGDLQFARNTACRRCGCPKHAEGGGADPRAYTPPSARGRPEAVDVFSRGAPPMEGGGARNMKPGDWECPRCGDLQFARNSECRKCGEPAPADRDSSRVGGAPMPAAGRPGDWNCPNCADLVFASKAQCRKCGTPKPEGAGAGAYAPPRGGGAGPPGARGQPGDWTCPDCGDLVFASKPCCRRCGRTPPEGTGTGGKAALRPGDWVCPNCQDLQFARNATCRKCGEPRPSDGEDSRSLREQDARRSRPY